MDNIAAASDRILEAYIGEYASGKSETAVNRALDLIRQGRQVTLVDLDIVEPFYTLRPIKEELESQGLSIIAWEQSQVMGLGEAGSLLKPEMRWALKRPGDIILDIGYGVEGAKTLNLIEGAWDSGLSIFVVISITRPMTSSVEDIVEFVDGLGTVHGLINNTHLGDETDEAIIQEGARIISQAGKVLGVPVVATTVEESLADVIGEKDSMGNPVRKLHRYMSKSFW